MLWSPAYLAAPTKGTSRARVAGILRDIKSRIRMTMEQEHEWGPYTTEDSGKHKAGQVQVAEIGDVAARNALVNVPEGALFILQDGLDHTLQIYDGGWVSIGEIRHGELDNLAINDAHPQYTLAANVNEPNWVFDMGGNDLSVPATPDESALGFVLANHANVDMPHGGFTNFSIYSDPIDPEIILATEEVDVTLDSFQDGAHVHLVWVQGLWLLPNIRQTSGSAHVFLSSTFPTNGVDGSNYGFQLRSAGAFQVRVRGYRARIMEN